MFHDAEVLLMRMCDVSGLKEETEDEEVHVTFICSERESERERKPESVLTCVASRASERCSPEALCSFPPHNPFACCLLLQPLYYSDQSAGAIGARESDFRNELCCA